MSCKKYIIVNKHISKLSRFINIKNKQFRRSFAELKKLQNINSVIRIYFENYLNFEMFSI